jgi:cell division protein FtsA
MTGAKLALDMLVLHGVRTQLTNAIRAVSSVPVDVHDVAFSGLCSALAVLTPEQKRSGAVVIDLGAGTTDYVAYADGMLMAAGAFGVGGEHVTNDIALGFNIPISQAERCKRESGSAVCGKGKSKQRVALPPDAGFPGRTISLKSLHVVMNARLEEIFRMIKDRLEAQDILRRVGMGVVLTGGGAHTPDLGELAQHVFSLPATVGKPLNVSGLATATEGPQYATCVGLAQYAFKMMTDGPRRAGALRGILGKLFGR